MSTSPKKTDPVTEHYRSGYARHDEVMQRLDLLVELARERQAKLDEVLTSMAALIRAMMPK